MALKNENGNKDVKRKIILLGFPVCLEKLL